MTISLQQKLLKRLCHAIFYRFNTLKGVFVSINIISIHTAAMKKALRIKISLLHVYKQRKLLS